MLLGDAIGRVNTGEEMLVKSFELGLNGTNLLIQGSARLKFIWFYSPLVLRVLTPTQKLPAYQPTHKVLQRKNVDKASALGLR